MPHEPSSRRHDKKEEELLLKMSRGEIACAECRRLKLRCDKKIPCSSCSRRGCSSICPTGALSPGQGSRFVLADTPELHTKMGEMTERIRQLEEALAQLQASVSIEEHPLLVPDLMNIKHGVQLEPFGSAKSKQSTPTTLASLGTLTIGENVEKARYFGGSAGTEALYLRGASLEPLGSSGHFEKPSVDIDLPSDILGIANAFPLGSTITPDRKYCMMVFEQLPDRLRASSLCELYYEQFAFSQQPVKRDELLEDYFTPTYKFIDARKAFPDKRFKPADFDLTHHKLAVLLAVFAVGSCVDLIDSDYVKQAETYYALSKAAIALQPIFEAPEIATVQALLLLAVYNECRPMNATSETNWGLSTLACKISLSLGLHRDSSRWITDAKVVERRRHLFWEVYMIDLFYSINLGRPATMRSSQIDCDLPSDFDGIDEAGQPIPSFWRSKHEFMREIYAPIAEALLNAVPPRYSIVLELDRKLRSKPVPTKLSQYVNNEDPEARGISLKEHVSSMLLSLYHAVAMTQLHRTYFAQALLDQPSNPLISPFAPSVMAVFRAASWIIKVQAYNIRLFPDLTARIWHPWTHLFSCALVMASIVITSPRSALAQQAYSELQQSCDSFEVGVRHSSSRRNANALKILRNMRSRAEEVFTKGNVAKNNTSPADLESSQLGPDELKIFGGQAKVVFARTLPIPKVRKSASIEQPSSLPSENTDSMVMEAHPSLAAYLGNIPFPASQNQLEIAKDPMVIDLNLTFSGQDSPPYFRLDSDTIDASPEWFQQVPFESTSMPWIPFENGPSTFSSLMSSNSPPDATGIDDPTGMFALPTGQHAESSDPWQSFVRQSGLLL